MIAKIIRNLAALLLIAAAVVLSYENSLNGEFVFDDSHFIVKNPNIQGLSFESLGSFVGGLQYIVGYNPFRCLVSFSYAVQYAAIPEEDRLMPNFVPDPAPFHLVNIAIHLVNAVLVFFAVRMLVGWRREKKQWAVPYFAALVSALLFATAAVATESVTYIVGRSNSLCTMFCLAALLAFLGARKAQEALRRSESKPARWTLNWLLLVLPASLLVYKAFVAWGARPATALFAAAFLLGTFVLAVAYLFVFERRRIHLKAEGLMVLAYFFFGLAALSKELAIVLPLLLLVLEVLVLSGGERGYMKTRWKHHALMLGTIVLMVLLRFAVIAATPPQAAEQWRGEGLKVDLTYLATEVSGPVMPGYLRQFFWPVQLNIDEDVRIFSPAQASRPLTVEFVVLFVILFAAVWLSKYARLFAAGVIWYFIALIPTSSVLKFGDVMDEGRIYLSIIGLCWAGGWAAVACFEAVRSKWPRIAAGALAAALIALIIGLNIYQTRKRNLDYLTADRMWYDTVMKSPFKGRVHEGLGYELMNVGQKQAELQGHFNTIMGILKKRGASARVSEAAQEALRERLDEFARLAEYQRHYLAASRTMFDAAILLNEGNAWEGLKVISRSPNWLLESARAFIDLQSSSAYLNLAVTYAARGQTLGYAVLLAEGRGLESAARREVERLMLLSRYKALGLFDRVIGPKFAYSPAPNVLANDSKLHTEMGHYYRGQGEYDKYENYLIRAEILARLALAMDSRFHAAIESLWNAYKELAIYYDPADTMGPPRKDKEKALAQYTMLEELLVHVMRVYNLHSHPDYDWARERIRALQE